MLRMFLGKAWPLVPQWKYLEACKVVHKYLERYIDRAQSDRETSARTHSLLAALTFETDDRPFIRHQISQGMMASQETTSSLLGNASFLLSRHPHNWQEIRYAALDPNNSVLDFETLYNLKAVRNILFGTLRLYPSSLSCSAVRSATQSSLPEADQTRTSLPLSPRVPILVMSWYAPHCDPSVFGDEPESFRPERWENISPKDGDFMGFGSGNRACMGQQKVLVETANVLMRLAQRYARLESRDSSQ